MSTETLAVAALGALCLTQALVYAVQHFLWQQERRDLQRMILADDLREFALTKKIERPAKTDDRPRPRSRVVKGHLGT